MAVTPKQTQQIIAGLQSQPELMKTFKEALGLEARAKEFHSKTFSRMDKFSGEESQWLEWVFNLIMTTKNVSVKIGEAMERIISQCGTKIEMAIVKDIDILAQFIGLKLVRVQFHSCELSLAQAHWAVPRRRTRGLKNLPGTADRDDREEGTGFFLLCQKQTLAANNTTVRQHSRWHHVATRCSWYG